MFVRKKQKNKTKQKPLAEELELQFVYKPSLLFSPQPSYFSSSSSPSLPHQNNNNISLSMQEV